MKRDWMDDVVAAYADNHTPAHRQVLLRLLPQHASLLRELFDLTDMLVDFFNSQEHRPSPTFRARLKRELLAQMERREERATPPPSAERFRFHSRRYLAAVGVGSTAVAVAAGAIAYWRSRHTRLVA